VEIHIGVLALKSRRLITTKVPLQQEKMYEHGLSPGQLTVLISGVMADYIRLRIRGYQYEEAAETAIDKHHGEISPTSNHRGTGSIRLMLKDVCMGSPLPPVSNVSLISRSMIMKRWETWTAHAVLRRRLPVRSRMLRSLRNGQINSIHLLSGTFDALSLNKKSTPDQRHRQDDPTDDEDFRSQNPNPSKRIPKTQPPSTDEDEEETQTSLSQNDMPIPRLPSLEIPHDIGTINLSIFGATQD